MDVFAVFLSEKLKLSLKKLQPHILIKLFEWIEAVSHEGLLHVRKRRGWHDEPLKGNRKGQRSIRLNKKWRAIYLLKDNGQIEFIEIIEVTPHDY